MIGRIGTTRAWRRAIVSQAGAADEEATDRNDFTVVEVLESRVVLV
jgi:hypothetical protein